MRLLLLLLPLFLFGRQITLDFLASKPRSIERDFYIWRYLDQNITPAQAQKALELSYHVNRKILRRYAQKRGDANISHIVECLTMKAQKLADQDPSCIAASISVAKFLQLPLSERKELLHKIAAFPIAKKLQPLAAKYPFFGALQTDFLSYFNAAGWNNRARFFNYEIDMDTMRRFAKSWRFRSFVRHIVLEDLNNIGYNLFMLDPDSLDAQTNFWIAIYAIKHDFDSLAGKFLRASLAKAKKRRHKNRARYWLYRTTHDSSHLNDILATPGVDIYKILAAEKLKKPLQSFALLSPRGHSDLNLSDPFEAARLYKLIRKAKKTDLPALVKRFDNIEGAPLYAIVRTKMDGYKKEYLITPYEALLDDTNKSRKILLYALARQESLFIPGTISYSYALGPLQFMPFLARHTAKELNVSDFDLDSMFEEDVAVRFANHHLDYLERHLAHPLLIAYAYNAGIGFTRRNLIDLFCKYDPMLAMELNPSGQNRHYGKKVMENFTLYAKIFHLPFSLTESLDRLKPLCRTLRSQTPGAKF